MNTTEPNLSKNCIKANTRPAKPRVRNLVDYTLGIWAQLFQVQESKLKGALKIFRNIINIIISVNHQLGLFSAWSQNTINYIIKEEKEIVACKVSCLNKNLDSYVIPYSLQSHCEVESSKVSCGKAKLC